MHFLVKYSVSLPAQHVKKKPLQNLSLKCIASSRHYCASAIGVVSL